MNLKQRVIEGIIEREGGYSDDPNDSGGETKYGITVGTARRYGYTGDMQGLPRSLAFDIYTRVYWDGVKASDLVGVSVPLVEELTDTAVNMGVTRAGVFLQRALNALNLRGQLYPDLKADGAIGPVTCSAVRKYATVRDIEILVKALNCLQGAAYVELAERREKDETFVYGWLKNRVKL